MSVKIVTVCLTSPLAGLNTIMLAGSTLPSIVDASAGARFLADVGARVGVVDVAANDVAAVLRHVGDVRADGDLIEAGNRRVADVLDGDAVQALRELFFRELLRRRTRGGKAERQGEQGR